MSTACKDIIRILISILTFCCMAGNAYAQNNPYKINDRLYPLYIKAYNQRKTDKCIPLADSLLHSSRAIRDKQGEINALTIKMQHEYYKKGNMAALEHAMRQVMAKAEQYKMYRFYDYAISLKVNYMAQEHRYIEALMYLDEQTKLAEERSDIEGVGVLHRMIGVIQQYRGELSQAINCYKDVIEEYKRNNTTRYISREYLSIADCHRMMADYENMAKAAEQALTYSTTPAEKYNTCLYQAYAYFMLGQDKEFADKYEYTKSHKLKLDNTYIIMNDAVEACKAIYDGRDNDAIKAIRLMAKKSEEESFRLYIAYYKRKKDFMKSIEYMNKLMKARNKQKRETFEFDSKSMDEIFCDQKMAAERQRLISANAKLELHNANMRLRNTTLELGWRRDAVTLAQVAMKRNELYDNNQKLVERQLSDSIAAQKIIHQTEERKYKMEQFVLLALLVMSIIIMLMTIAYTLQKRHLNKKLASANTKLKKTISKLNEAKEKAQESGKMKTLFVQNMSHEIKTPLNAIVGFSHILTDMGDNYTKEEKEDMAKYITDNSELLTTLINDILDLTQIKSGGLAIKKAPMRVNEVCKECMETVRHKLVPEVSLNFNTSVSDAMTVCSDRHRISEVLINMLTNAEKNTTKGSITLDCSCDKNQGMVTFTVTDTGVGVAREKQEDIFKRFKKLDTIKPGSGIGLDICRCIASQLGGYIDIDHDYTGGARFWFTIPAE